VDGRLAGLAIITVRLWNTTSKMIVCTSCERSMKRSSCSNETLLRVKWTGLRNMIENDRYSGDEIQQASAITAAVREVALLLIAQQLEVGVDVAAGTDRKAAVEEMRAVLRIALGQCLEP
jgi:DNA-binding FrmR family transcriptional regulator